MSTPEQYATREDLNAILDEVRALRRRNSEPSDNGGGRDGDPLTRTQFNRALQNLRDEVEDLVRRAGRTGILSDADRAAIAADVCDELDRRYISDLDADEVDGELTKRSGSKGNGKSKTAGSKPAKGAEPEPEKPKRRWGGLLDD